MTERMKEWLANPNSINLTEFAKEHKKRMDRVGAIGIPTLSMRLWCSCGVQYVVSKGITKEGIICGETYPVSHDMYLYNEEAIDKFKALMQEAEALEEKWHDLRATLTEITRENFVELWKKHVNGPIIMKYYSETK